MSKYSIGVSKIYQQLQHKNKYGMYYAWEFFEDDSMFEWDVDKNKDEVNKLEEEFKQNGWKTRTERWIGKNHYGIMLRVFKD